MADQLQELMDIIRFTEDVSLRIYAQLEEADIFSNVIAEFRRSKKYTASISLLTQDRTQLRIIASMKSGMLRKLESSTRLKLKRFRIELDRSTTYRRVIREGETLQVGVGDIIKELFPGPLAALIIKLGGYKRTNSIVTPLRRGEEIIGAFAMSSPGMAEYFIPSVRNLAHHISTALLLASEQKSRKQAEDRLVWSQKMEMIGRLAGGIAHEFNNILITIKGYAELGQSGLERSDPEYRNFAKIIKGVDRANGLVDQLLAFARRQEYRPTLINFNDLFVDLTEVLRRIMGDTIRLKTNLESDLWGVRADRAKIEQVIINLAINARDAMPEGGNLTIETTNVNQFADDPGGRVDLQPGQYVAFSLRDTGQGMSDEVLTHLFEPFFSTKEQGKGTGLGLATCYGIVKEQGGEIGVKSKVGKGTTVIVYLARDDGADEATTSQ
jgi:signal transduction histidine kinase